MNGEEGHRFSEPANSTQRLLRASAPLRGYGMERVPGLRNAYRWAWDHLAPTGVREITVQGARLSVDFADTSIVPSLWLTRAYEPTFSKGLDTLVQSGDRVVDVGAHVGYYSIRLAQIIGVSGRVDSYEPQRTQWALLNKNVQRNSVRDQVVMHRKAVSDVAARRETLWRDISNSGGASLARRAVMNADGSEGVQVVTLDSEMASSGLSRVDLIKIDVQGYEARVLAGAVRLIEEGKPVLAFEYNPAQIEAAGDDHLGVLHGLGAAGYELYMANEYAGTIRKLGALAIHSFCIEEKGDGSGFVNVIAIHRDDGRG